MNSLEKPSAKWLEQNLSKCWINLKENALPINSFFNWTICDSLFDVLIQFGDRFDKKVNEILGIKEVSDEVAQRKDEYILQYAQMVGSFKKFPKTKGNEEIPSDIDIMDEEITTTNSECVYDVALNLIKSKANHDYIVREASERFKAIIRIGHADMLNCEQVNLNYTTVREEKVQGLIPFLVLHSINDDKLYVLPVFTKSDAMLEDFVKYAFQLAYEHRNDTIQQVLFR
ncbi:hypothetical protein ABD87_22715 [Lysinibacillus sphaericus]|uniref:hypothetical protein n=1 Tax=Lysinibacillus sphaericus TaxID=1421 RepID=UPI0018CF3F47|nr:hypothetical protein [Lysinibacillus sphaericus]MBG9732240.1 hypothetical protein [Lysinibacillus sphaericus]